jgi:hypothetical protein
MLKLISKNPRESFTPPDHRYSWSTMAAKAANVTIPTAASQLFVLDGFWGIVS